MKHTLVAALAVVVLLCAEASVQPAHDPGLLFYLSGDRALKADHAEGASEPNFASDVQVIADGAKGSGLQCGHTQLLSYRAPGNIYAQRGTLSFFWRSREPVGPTAFPIFRVGYADHSSWDMVWLRIDYNGHGGFDAFVTDASLARTRVSIKQPAFPGPSQWTHLALAWDETRGIRFFVDGRLAGKVEGTAIFDAALDQFGPHSRIISPYQVQSAYNFVRGGDLDELRIYDRMLSDENVAALAKGDGAGAMPMLTRALSVPQWRDEWWYRFGWNRTGDAPPLLGSTSVAIRKVEIHDAYDLKRWWWKGTDGIRETTWPGVYNRSRLAGRNDYFQLPDWDTYSLGGKEITFSMPDEPWNQIEISGAASGSMTIDGASTPLFARPTGQERTFHRVATPVRGQRVRFTNVDQETPIGELSAYNVTDAREPSGTGKLSYRLTGLAEPAYPNVKPLVAFVAGRYPADQRDTMVALPEGAPRLARKPSAGGLPIVHVLVPSDFRDVNFNARRTDFSYSWANMAGGLDGVALDLPALKMAPTHGDAIPLNVQIKDPIWPLRNLLDVSFSVKAGMPHTVWFDTRDRILPNDRPLYFTIASASPEFDAADLEGAAVRLIFKPLKDAAREHVADRFIQVRDNYAQLLEERPNTRRLDLYTRLEGDLTDLLRVDPDHALGRAYWYDFNKEQPRPAVALKSPPEGVPLWAFRQVENLRSVKRLVNWFIDNRQIDNGEFGGGLSDDGDLTNLWPSAAFMGVSPEKIRASLLREMEAFYAQGMFTNGLSTIQTDELHSYEEGIQTLGQSMLLDYASPTHLERAMETSLGIERITGVNAAGHRHIRSAYFSGTKVAEEGVWGWSKPSSYLFLHPALELVEFNGSPRVRKFLLELADALLAHRKQDANGSYAIRATVEFATDKDLAQPSDRAWPLMWAAFRWTGDRKYLQPFVDAGPRGLPVAPGNALELMSMKESWKSAILGDPGLAHFAWQVTGDTSHLERLYADQIAAAAVREYINTEGSVWIDRVTASDAELQRARLGGVALVRNSTYPGQIVSWSFAKPDAEEDVAILVPEATPKHVVITAFNVSQSAVSAKMTAWDIEPGMWQITQGPNTRTIELERTRELDLTFEPRQSTKVEMTLVSAGVPYWSRPDLGIAERDVHVNGSSVDVTVHSLGSVDAAASKVVVRSRAGQILGSASVPALRAPVDLQPKAALVHVRLARSADLAGGSVTIESSGRIPEITRRNNVVTLAAR
jgi:Concanavalin A-like lectin/glucanases superfamily